MTLHPEVHEVKRKMSLRRHASWDAAFGQRVDALWRQRFRTKRDFAAALGRQPHYATYLTQGRVPTAENLARLARVLDVPMESLVSGQEPGDTRRLNELSVTVQKLVPLLETLTPEHQSLVAECVGLLATHRPDAEIILRHAVLGIQAASRTREVLHGQQVEDTSQSG
jgi:transcriptional regulator with XRE-family HTH domain